MEGMKGSDNKRVEHANERGNSYAERNRRRFKLHGAIANYMKTFAKTAAVGSLLAGSPVHAETQKTNSLQGVSKIESQEKSRNTVYVAKEAVNPSPKSLIRQALLKKELADPTLTRAKFENNILANIFEVSKNLRRDRSNVSISFNTDFSIKLPDDTVEVALPDGTTTAFSNGNEENSTDGNSFEVVYGTYVYAVTALHNLPAGAPGWTFIKGKSDIAVKPLRPAKQSENLAHFSPQTTQSVIGKIGTTTIESQGLNPDRVPYSGVLLPLSILRHFYDLDNMLTEIQEKYPHIDYASIMKDGGVCKVLPVQGFKDVNEMQKVLDVYRSGAPEMVASGDGKSLNQVVGVQSISFKVAINRPDGGFHVICYSDPEQLQRVLDKATKESSIQSARAR